jgi:Ca2+-transporting ATPase
MVAINDPPRWNTSYSIAKCRKAGIKVMMLTDDTATAAISVARKLNIALAKPIVK